MESLLIKTEESYLIERCIDGDRHAQERLYKKYVGAIYNRVIRMLPNRFEAEDVVQETFVKVFKHLSRYKSDSSLGTWIRRIAINTALDVIRKDSKMKFVEMDNSDISDAPISEDDSFWTLEMVHESIKKLPKGNRVIFTLYALEGYDHKEISQILGVTESTSKTQYKRAKDTLKKLMRDHYGQG